MGPRGLTHVVGLAGWPRELSSSDDMQVYVVHRLPTVLTDIGHHTVTVVMKSLEPCDVTGR